MLIRDSEEEFECERVTRHLSVIPRFATGSVIMSRDVMFLSTVSLTIPKGKPPFVSGQVVTNAYNYYALRIHFKLTGGREQNRAFYS